MKKISHFLSIVVFLFLIGTVDKLYATPFDGITQQVFLDFDTETNEVDPIPDHVYTTTEREAILGRLQDDYASFDYVFGLTAPSTGPFSTLLFNADGIAGGLASQIDFLNVDHSDDAEININSFLGGAGDPAATSENFIAAAATVAAHELGHLAGLRHGDSFGPIGSGIHDLPGAGSYLPSYPGPTGADETTGHIMASPAAVGSTLFDLVGDPFFSERSAVKLSFNEAGTVVLEQGGAHGTMATAQALTLDPLTVSNTVLSGDNVGNGFLVDAIHVFDASISAVGESDFYSFSGSEGDMFNLEVMSNVFDFAFPIDSTVEIFDSNGIPVAYYDSTAFNDDEFETFDSIIIDLLLPADDTYFVEVDTFRTPDTGDYELFMYTFDTFSAPAPIPEPATIVLLGVGVFSLLAIKRRIGRRNR